MGIQERVYARSAGMEDHKAERGKGAGRRCWPAAAVLDAERAELVRTHVPLVGLHLKRRVGAAFRDRSRRNWDDLFQEGCLGLIKAALRFDATAGIPFPAFALPRIRCAINKALEALDDIPEMDGAALLSTAGRKSLRIHDPLPDDAGAEAAQREEHLRERLESAVRQAAARLDVPAPAASALSDAGTRLRTLVTERFLTCHAEDRRSLRTIARETGATYACVARYARDLRDATRETLSADPGWKHEKEKAQSASDTGLENDAATRRHDPMGGAGRRSPRRRLRRVSAARIARGKRLRQGRYMARRRARLLSDPSEK